MSHLKLLLYLLALLAGAASLSQTFSLWQRYQKERAGGREIGERSRMRLYRLIRANALE